MTGSVHLGIQGWNHAEWVGSAYPADIQSADMLGAYAKRFPTVEIDDTFYGIPPEPVVTRWRESVPADFSFAVKVPQQITHEHRFAGGGGLLNKFLHRVSQLESKLGPVLFLAPPGFGPDVANRDTLATFVKELPEDFSWALELRHVDWFTDELFDMLAGRNVAIVAGENRWINRSSMLDLARRPTAKFGYVRWNNRAFADRAVERPDCEEHVTAIWVRTLEKMSNLVEAVYGYFNIAAFGDGLRSAEELQCSIGQQWLEATVSGDATVSIDRDES